MDFAAEPESKSNLKHQAIQKSVPDLIKLLDAGDPMSLAVRLFSEKLLIRDTLDEIKSKTGTEKARTIVLELHKKVEAKPCLYEKLLKALVKEEMHDAIELIKKNYKGKCIFFFKGTLNQINYVDIHNFLYIFDLLGQFL